MTPRHKLLAEQVRIRKRVERRSKANNDDRDRYRAIDRELNRLDLLDLIGVEHGVRIRYRRPSRDKGHALNDAFGKLTDVRRKRCSVDFGAHGLWSFAIDDIAPADKEQGLLLTTASGA
jgi:hypothetical protein